MTQNLVSQFLTPNQLSAAIAAITELEINLAPLFALPPARKKSMKKMGDKSETFVRQSVRILDENPQIVPPSIEMSTVRAQLAMLDQLRPLAVRLARLSERASDTDLALGSDLMTVALQGYGLLKLTGRAQGLESLRRELSVRFARGRNVAKAAVALPVPVAQAS